MESKNKKKKLLILLAILVLLAGLLTGLILITTQGPQYLKKKAVEEVSCPKDGATCSWSPAESATSYSYSITDETTGEVIKGTTDQTQVQFTPVVGHVYKCTVVPVNSCGEGPEATAQNICLAGTPTPSPEESPTPTETPTLTPEITEEPTPTEEVIPTETPTPSPTEEILPTNTPLPTSQLQPTTPKLAVATNTPAPTITPTPTEIVIGQVQPTVIPSQGVTLTPTPQPTAPVAGTSTGVLLMVVAGILLVSFILIF